MRLLAIFLLCFNVCFAQVYDSAGFVKVRPSRVDTIRQTNTVVIRDTVIKVNTVVIRDTVKVTNTIIIRDTVCPGTTPPPPPPVGGYSLSFSSNFDKSSDLLCCQGGNGVITTGPYWGDPAFYSRPANVSSGIRSEVQYDDGTTPNEGAIEWEVVYEVIVPDNGHSFQFHPNTGGGSASPGLWHIGGKFVWVNWKGGGNAQHPTGVTIEKGKLYKMRVEYKFGSNGYFNFYINGVKNNGGSWTGQVGDGSGQYMKLGYNGWDSKSTTSRIWYNNLKVYKKN